MADTDTVETETVEKEWTPEFDSNGVLKSTSIARFFEPHGKTKELMPLVKEFKEQLTETDREQIRSGLADGTLTY